MLSKFIRKHSLTIVFSVLFLLLPYYIFGGKLYIGGDDTRLFYIYPLLYLHFLIGKTIEVFHEIDIPTFLVSTYKYIFLFFGALLLIFFEPYRVQI